MDKIIKKYIVSCPYCEKTYTKEIVDGSDFCCPSCGGAGNLQNAIEVKEQPKEKIVYVTKKENADDSGKPDWYGENGKTKDYEPETENDKIAKVLAYVGVIFFLIICFGIGIGNKEAQKQEERDRIAAKNPLEAMRMAGDETEDAKEIRATIKDFFLALSKEDYAAIKEMSYKDETTKNLTDQEWITLIQNSVYGKYYGAKKVSVKEAGYQEGYPLPAQYAAYSDIYYPNNDGQQEKTKEFYQIFKVTLSDGTTYKIKFRSDNKIEWEICFWE